jgi:hypothetical protein
MPNPAESNDETIFFQYRFRLKSGEETQFRVVLDGGTLNLRRAEEEAPPPSWTELAFCTCPHCPLDPARHRHCPIAVSLAGIVCAFGKAASYEEVDVVLDTAERRYEKHTTLQKGLSSLVGIYMVTSGCPVMEWLKPMVRFHLPFATEEETKYRVLSMYLLAQFFLRRRGERPDWDMAGLVGIYENVRLVNRGIADRLSKIEIDDANVNALLILDCFAGAVTFSLCRERLADLESLFGAYFT